MSKDIQITNSELLSDNWYVLKKVTYTYTNSKNENKKAVREVYDRGNGAAILLYNSFKKTVILTKQFRLPTFMNQNKSGMMIEVCAGVLDEDDPDECIKREVLEETGFKINKVHKVFESYMSPGAITEILHFYVAEYHDDMKVNEGGGLDDEQEDIDVLELNFDEAYGMIENGQIKDSKSIMLLQYAKVKDLV